MKSKRLGKRGIDRVEAHVHDVFADDRDGAMQQRAAAQRADLHLGRILLKLRIVRLHANGRQSFLAQVPDDAGAHHLLLTLSEEAGHASN